MTEKAVSPSALAPGLYLKVNLIAGAAAPGGDLLRTLLIAQKSAAGDLTVDSEIRTGGGPDTAATAFGVGMGGHLAAKQLYSAFPGGVIDFAAPSSGAGTATEDWTFAGSVAQNTPVDINVCGRAWQEAWLFGETADEFADKVIAGINSRTDDLPVIASDGGVGVVTVTYKGTGNAGNDIIVRMNFAEAQNGTETVTPSVATNLSGGTTDPDYSDILAAAQGREYHIILGCMSNTDAETTGSTSNAERVITHIKTYNEGLDAKLQTLCYGTHKTQAAAQAAAQARNEGFVQCVHGTNFQSLPCEIAAAEAGDRLAAISIDPAANRIGNELGNGTLYGSADINGDKPTESEANAGIGAGLSLMTYDAADNVLTMRPVTSYSQNSSGGPDRRLLDMQNTDATYIIARDLRSALPAEFPNAKIIPDQAPGEQDIPEGVTEERDVRTFVISRMEAWRDAGVILGSKLQEAIDNNELIVEVDPQDASQVNIVVPMTIIPGTAKFGVVANRNPA